MITIKGQERNKINGFSYLPEKTGVKEKCMKTGLRTITDSLNVIIEMSDGTSIKWSLVLSISSMKLMGLLGVKRPFFDERKNIDARGRENLTT